jgi:serine/threonine-protein kinase
MSSDPPAKGKRRIRLGKYQVVAHIATGGMGAVYKAQDTDLGREVALKVLQPDLVNKPGMLERFQREARSAARLRHENIVTLYDFGEEQGTYFIALEFIDGVDLHDYIRKKGKLDPEAACEITRQAALALEHASKQGVVHRDIKPSNFLLTRKDRKLLVKMTDFGLAREREAEDADEASRITRAGTTVGTVDYISPEQARDSGSADIRSDIYSLGCTLYHMLTGQPPFPEGSTTERLFKHIGEEPEDVGRLNPDVPEALRAVLRRMMAKKPDQRYQTPASLLRDLAKVDPNARPVADRLQALASLADMEAPRPRKPRRSRAADSTEDLRPPSSGNVRPPSTGNLRPPSSGNVRPASAPAQRAAPYRRPRDSGVISRVGPTAEELSDNPVIFGRPVSPAVLVAGVIGVCLLIAGVVLLLVLLTGRGTRPKAPTAPATQPIAVASQALRTEPEHPAVAAAVAATPSPAPPPGGPPRLYTPGSPIDAAGLRQELEAPWAGDTGPAADTPVYTVSRAALLATGGKSGPPTGLTIGGGPASPARSYVSLADACAAVPLGRTGIIEVRDNGPFFLAPATVTQRNLVLRAAKGYRPLLVWDVATSRPEGSAGGPAFVALSGGNLTLENLHVAARWVGGGEPGCLFRVTGGDFLARDCVFSVAGEQGAGVSLVRLEGPRRSPGVRCRLSRCFARGGVVGIELWAPGARALLDDCLVVGGDLPLLQVRAAAAPPTSLSICRSTLIGRQTLLEVGPAAAGDSRPALDCTAWDCVLARSNREAGGDLVVLAKGTAPDALHWRAVNVLYAGWANLLGGPDGIPAADLPAWHRLWKQTEGDKVLSDTWPPGEVHDAAEVPAAPYGIAATPVGYAASEGPGTIGCEVQALPPARDNWLALTYDRFFGPPIDYLSRAAVPPPPAGDGQPYAGGRLDLNQTDLGTYLETVARSRPLAPRVVLYLSGSGERQTHPVRVKGCHLVLIFEPPAGKAEPLTLVPPDAAAGPEALIDVDGGSLDLVGAHVRFPDFKTALLPAYLVAVRGGNLRLCDCRLQGPLAHPPEGYRGLIRFAGSGKSDPDKANVCAVATSQLLSGRDGIELIGTGARLGVEGSVLVCGEDAVVIKPGDTAGPGLNVQAVVEHTTVAAARAVLRGEDTSAPTAPFLPAIVQTTGCAFMNPFAPGGTTARAGMFLAADNALPHGLLVWQSDGDLFDRRLYYQAAPEGAPPDKPQTHAVWANLWGPAGDSRPILDVALRGTLDLERLQLGRLALPRVRERPVGADLVRLGILQK